MAKPKHGRVNNAPSSPSRPRRAPSPAVLSALALIAAVPPVVAGSPVPSGHPPAFLCPFIERDNVVDPSSVPPAPAPGGTPSKCDVVADKYVQESDSLWHKTDKWTLYGSTCWSGSAGSSSEMQSQPSSSQPSRPTLTNPPSKLGTSIDTSELPAGWGSSTSTKSTTESSTILALAIVLAGSICFFMIGCVIWRRRKKRARDIERKLGQNRSSQDDPQDNKMRIWAKATARWKSNIRQSARRRRKRQCVPSTANRPLSPTSDCPHLSLVAPSVSSRRVSIASQEPDSSRPEAVLSRDGNVIESSSVPRDSPRPTSPPTYGASFVPRPSSRSAIPHSNSTPSVVGPDSVHPSFIDDEPLPYVPPSDGHVATDDKSQLAHIRQLASSPPTSVNIASASTMQSVSAPEWHEVEDSLEDLAIHLAEVPTPFHHFPLPPSFPPPPSKTDIPSPFGYLDDHPFYYAEGDDMITRVSTPGPSVSTLPSAPSLDDPGLEPSAPPLECDDELFQDWDGTPSYAQEVSTSADLSSVPAGAAESPIPVSHGASFPSVAMDGILPRYHP